MLDDGYMWIVTDAVVGNQEEFTERKVSKTNWNGILGTLPSFRNDVDNMYHYYVVEYERRFKVNLQFVFHCKTYFTLSGLL